MPNELSYVKPTRRKKAPGITARYRAKRKRAEAPVLAKVRAEVEELDGYCRFRLGSGYERIVGECEHRSELMHLEEKKRARTRGMAPEERHCAEGSMMGCKKHHGLYDAGDIQIAMGERGANGPISVETESGVYMIPARRIS